MLGALHSELLGEPPHTLVVWGVVGQSVQPTGSDQGRVGGIKTRISTVFPDEPTVGSGPRAPHNLGHHATKAAHHCWGAFHQHPSSKSGWVWTQRSLMTCPAHEWGKHHHGMTHAHVSSQQVFLGQPEMHPSAIPPQISGARAHFQGLRTSPIDSEGPICPRTNLAGVQTPLHTLAST